MYVNIYGEVMYHLILVIYLFLVISNGLKVQGNSNVYGNIYSEGDVSLNSSNLFVSSDISSNGNLKVQGYSYIDGSMGIGILIPSIKYIYEETGTSGLDSNLAYVDKEQ